MAATTARAARDRADARGEPYASNERDDVGEARARDAVAQEIRRRIVDLKLELLHAQWLRKYRPDQPRVPAGSREGGQWTHDDPLSDEVSSARRKGGLSSAVMDWTVRQFVSKYCRGEINREIPGQFRDVTLGDLIDLAKGGDAAAKKCYKILNQGRFRK